MKHDIPLLKSDFDFKWLSALQLYFRTLGFLRTRCLMKERNCNILEECMHISKRTISL